MKPIIAAIIAAIIVGLSLSTASNAMGVNVITAEDRYNDQTRMMYEQRWPMAQFEAIRIVFETPCEGTVMPVFSQNAIKKLNRYGWSQGKDRNCSAAETRKQIERIWGPYLPKRMGF